MYKDENHKPIKNQSDNFWLLNEGKAEGTIIGGNINTFRLLYGTEYLPKFSDIILFLEDDCDTVGDYMQYEFRRNIYSITQQNWFDNVRGIVFGRFQIKSNINKDFVLKLIADSPKLSQIPILGNVDFGHNKPMISFPIGGKASLDINLNMSTLDIIEH